MRHRIYFHVVWTTRDRRPVIDSRVARFLQRYLSAVAQQERARIIELGMVRTHVHLLIRAHPTTSIPRLLQRLKGGSGVLANREGHAEQKLLKWAKGYNIESVSAGSVPVAREYIQSQPLHHPSELIPDWPAATVA